MFENLVNTHYPGLYNQVTNYRPFKEAESVHLLDPAFIRVHNHRRHNLLSLSGLKLHLTPPYVPLELIQGYDNRTLKSIPLLIDYDFYFKGNKCEIKQRSKSY